MPALLTEGIQDDDIPNLTPNAKYDSEDSENKSDGKDEQILTSAHIIHLARKIKMTSSAKKDKSKKRSMLFDNRGFPNPQDGYEAMLPETSGGGLLRKRKHPALPF